MFNLFYILFGCTAFFAVLAIVVLVLLHRDRSAVYKEAQSDYGPQGRGRRRYTTRVRQNCTKGSTFCDGGSRQTRSS